MDISKRAVFGQLPRDICEQSAMGFGKLTERVERLQVAHVFGVAILRGAIGDGIAETRKPVYKGRPLARHRLEEANHGVRSK